MERQKLMEFLENNKDQMIADLCEFVRIPSISDNITEVRRALDFIIDLGKRMGFEARSVLDGRVGLIEAGEGSETLGILSHVDVVSPGNLEAWQSQPFEPVIRDGSIYGRGTLDDKGAAIASLYAMKAVTELGIPLKKKVQLILGTQEEVDWSDMRDYVKEFPLPDYGFTPDGEFPICNIEKGAMDVEILIPLEKPVGDGFFIIDFSGGTATNIVPGEAEARLLKRTAKADGTFVEEEIKVSATGKAVHSCQPEKGDNAIINLCNMLLDMDLSDNTALRLVKELLRGFSDIYCRGIGLYSENEYLNGEFIHRNTISVTRAETKQEGIFANFNIRFSYGADDRDFVEAIDKVAAGIGGRVESINSLPAVYISKEKPFLKGLAGAYEEISGLPNEFALAYGGSYAKAMENIVSWGPIFPGEEDTCHEENEYISIESLMLNAKIFATAIGDIVLSEDSFI